MQNFINLHQSAAELLPFVWKFNMAAVAILPFIFVQYYCIAVYKTLNLVHLPNCVQMCAKMNEVWAINKIQDGACRHLEFVTMFNFGHMAYFR